MHSRASTLAGLRWLSLDPRASAYAASAASRAVDRPEAADAKSAAPCPSVLDCADPALATSSSSDELRPRPAPSPLPSPRPAVIAPLAPEHYKVQMTVSRETHDKLRR